MAGLNFANPGQDKISPAFAALLGETAKEFGGLRINSGYRSPEYNRKVGGAKKSFHTTGNAADIDMSGLDEAGRSKLVQSLKDKGVTGFITYSNSPDMLHVDMRPGKPHFMHDKTAGKMKSAPKWFQALASGDVQEQGGGMAALVGGKSRDQMARKKVSDPAVLAQLNGSTVNPKNNRPNLPNEDGSFSTELSITVTNPRLNGGRPTNIPSIWDGKRFDPVQEDAIVEQALKSGQQFPAFNSIEEAVAAAKSRSENLGAGTPKRKKVTDPAVLAKLSGAPKIDPATNQPAGVPEFKPVGVGGYNPETGEVENTGVVDKLGAFISSAIEGVPIAGPTLKKAATGTAAGIVSGIEGKEFGDVYDDMARNTADLERDNPGWATAGYVTGAIAPMIPLGATSLGGRALGVTGNSLKGRIAASGVSNALISGADTAARGGDVSDVAKSTGIGGVIGLAIPAAGAVLNSMGRYAKDTVGPRLNAITRPGYEAERRVGTAMTRDAGNSMAPVLSQADEASAALNQQQLLNVDRGGETTRALARSAANTDPEARALIEKTASDRFGSQGDRARSFIDRLTGGATDDLAVQEGLKNAARQVNKPAYDKAFSASAAQDMSSPALLDMLKSPAMRQAAAVAEKRGADRAVVEGFETVRSPFVFDEAGNVSMKEGVKPTLQFWNQVKINLDGEIGKAQRAGDNALARDLTGLKSKLVSELDTAVPEYATARKGAAAFFGAEDALDAGKKFVTMNRQNDEVAAALKKMKPAERTSFAVGFASELKDAIAQAGDRTNVINKIFGSQQSRDKIKLALGPQAYGEFEQFVKVENAMDMIRSAMGNSTTARQLMEMGLAGGAIGGGTALYTGDWTQGLTVGVLAGLAKRYSSKVDDRVTKRVAELLLSNDPQALKQAVTLAKNSQKASAALDAIQGALSGALKGTGNVATRPERKPLEITVTQPNGVEAAP